MLFKLTEEQGLGEIHPDGKRKTAGIEPLESGLTLEPRGNEGTCSSGGTEDELQPTLPVWVTTQSEIGSESDTFTFSSMG
jgi:hypothetical protein